MGACYSWNLASTITSIFHTCNCHYCPEKGYARLALRHTEFITDGHVRAVGGGEGDGVPCKSWPEPARNQFMILGESKT